MKYTKYHTQIAQLLKTLNIKKYKLNETYWQLKNQFCHIKLPNDTKLNTINKIINEASQIIQLDTVEIHSTHWEQYVHIHDNNPAKCIAIQFKFVN